jgi:hypothetical protein
MTTAPNTSSSTSSQYTRRIIARQRSIDSQEEPNDEPDPQADQSEQSISTGSLEDYYLLIDPQYNIDESITTPPPIADPPSDASYDESFIEMVKQTVQRARIAYAESHPNEENDDQESISNYLNSQASVVLSSQDSNQPNNDVYDNEARVEQARRDVDPQYDDIPLPYYLKEEQESSQKLIDSQMSLPEFAIIKKNSNTVNEVEYVTNKKPEKKETEKEERAADDARSYFERERDLYKNAIKELAQWKQEEEEEEEGSSTDYSSWLCFDNETEVAQFKVNNMSILSVTVFIYGVLYQGYNLQ